MTRAPQDVDVLTVLEKQSDRFTQKNQGINSDFDQTFFLRLKKTYHFGPNSLQTLSYVDHCLKLIFHSKGLSSKALCIALKLADCVFFDPSKIRVRFLES